MNSLILKYFFLEIWSFSVSLNFVTNSVSLDFSFKKFCNWSSQVFELLQSVPGYCLWFPMTLLSINDNWFGPSSCPRHWTFSITTSWIFDAAAHPVLDLGCFNFPGTSTHDHLARSSSWRPLARLQRGTSGFNPVGFCLHLAACPRLKVRVHHLISVWTWKTWFQKQ